MQFILFEGCMVGRLTSMLEDALGSTSVGESATVSFTWLQSDISGQYFFHDRYGVVTVCSIFLSKGH